MSEDAFNNINKFMKGMVILFVIAVIGSIGSIALDYIGANGIVEFLAWIVAALIIISVIVFIGKVIGLVIDGSVFIIKKLIR